MSFVHFCSLVSESIRRIPRFFIFFGLIFLGVGFRGTPVHAASFYLSPSASSYTIRQNFSINVMVSSADQALNAFSGTVSFPSDKLSISSISKSGTIVSLWVQEPSFSNSAGTLHFEGMVLNPGYKGNAGKVLTINFSALREGSAAVQFSSGSILANDGEGTDITSGLGKAAFTIKPSAPLP
ncbi:MAG TPA: hypothetical protein VFQ60_04940, partial [Patescibacteria group bacterium]|nr:hypothetical protein [Patescibacteria group bacterium]